MWFDSLFKRAAPPRPPAPVSQVQVGSQSVPLLLVRHPRARRYLLRLRADGSARVTIPRGGSATAARQFAERNTAWLAQQLQRLAAQPARQNTWPLGADILFRGELVRLETSGPGVVSFGGESVRITGSPTDLRPAIEQRLRQLAGQTLPTRLLELAAAHQLTVQRVTVRNQKSRWGSCSRRGNISLNWRLIQTPDFVRDYICLHELMHLRELNHSARFWREVESVCQDYQTAERWLKQHAGLLR